MRLTSSLRNVFDPAFMRKVKRTLSNYAKSMDRTERQGISREAFVDIDEKGAAWYLGHMQSAARELSAKLKEADFVLEVRDARLPFTTANPNLRRGAAGKPRLIVFNKAELANADANRALQRYYDGHGDGPAKGTFAVFASARRGGADIVETVRRFALAVVPAPPFRTAARVGLVVGMPNVGKSTLVNALRLAHEAEFHRDDFARSRTAERVGIAPGTTRAPRLVPLSRDPPLVLWDTPGLTLPGCVAREAGLRLAACGLLPTSALALPPAVVARYVYDVLLAAGMGEHLAACLHLARPPRSFDDCAALLCERSGTSGQSELGSPDAARAHRFLLHDFQAGRLGRLTMDALPGRARQAAASPPPPAGLLENDGETAERATQAHEDAVLTHHVESEEVVERCPEHMRGVLAALRGPLAGGPRGTPPPPEEGVISRRKGPISRASAFEEAYQRYTRLAEGR